MSQGVTIKEVGGCYEGLVVVVVFIHKRSSIEEGRRRHRVYTQDHRTTTPTLKTFDTRVGKGPTRDP